MVDSWRPQQQQQQQRCGVGSRTTSAAVSAMCPAAAAVDRRSVRKELLSWAKKVPVAVGLEAIAKNLIGEKAVQFLLEPFYGKQNIMSSQFEPDYSVTSELLQSDTCSSTSQHKLQETADDTEIPNTSDTAVWSGLGSDAFIKKEVLDVDVPLDLSRDSAPPITAPSVAAAVSTGGPIRVPNPPQQKFISSKRSASNASTSANNNNHASHPHHHHPYVRKNYTELELAAATIDVRSGRIGTRRASDLYGIPRSTLRNKILRMKAIDDGSSGVLAPLPPSEVADLSSAAAVVRHPRNSSKVHDLALSDSHQRPACGGGGDVEHRNAYRSTSTDRSTSLLTSSLDRAPFIYGDENRDRPEQQHIVSDDDDDYNGLGRSDGSTAAGSRSAVRSDVIASGNGRIGCGSDDGLPLIRRLICKFTENRVRSELAERQRLIRSLSQHQQQQLLAAEFFRSTAGDPATAFNGASKLKIPSYQPTSAGRAELASTTKNCYVDDDCSEDIYDEEAEAIRFGRAGKTSSRIDELLKSVIIRTISEKFCSETSGRAVGSNGPIRCPRDLLSRESSSPEIISGSGFNVAASAFGSSNAGNELLLGRGGCFLGSSAASQIAAEDESASSRELADSRSTSSDDGSGGGGGGGGGGGVSNDDHPEHGLNDDNAGIAILDNGARDVVKSDASNADEVDNSHGETIESGTDRGGGRLCRDHNAGISGTVSNGMHEIENDTVDPVTGSDKTASHRDAGKTPDANAGVSGANCLSRLNSGASDPVAARAVNTSGGGGGGGGGGSFLGLSASADVNEKSTHRRHHRGTSSYVDGGSSSTKKTRPKRGQYRKYNRQLLLEAVRAVQQGDMSVHRAGSFYGVPHSTLEYKVKERHLLRQRKSAAASGAPPSGSSGSQRDDETIAVKQRKLQTLVETTTTTTTLPASASRSLDTKDGNGSSPTSTFSQSFGDAYLKQLQFAAAAAAKSNSSTWPYFLDNSDDGMVALSAWSRLLSGMENRMLFGGPLSASPLPPPSMPFGFFGGASSLPVGFGWPPPHPSPSASSSSLPAAPRPSSIFPSVAEISPSRSDLFGSHQFSMSASDLLKRFQQKVQAKAAAAAAVMGRDVNGTGSGSGDDETDDDRLSSVLFPELGGGGRCSSVCSVESPSQLTVS